MRSTKYDQCLEFLCSLFCVIDAPTVWFVYWIWNAYITHLFTIRCTEDAARFVFASTITSLDTVTIAKQKLSVLIFILILLWLSYGGTFDNILEMKETTGEKRVFNRIEMKPTTKKKITKYSNLKLTTSEFKQNMFNSKLSVYKCV